MYMVMQGLCTPWSYCIPFVPYKSRSALFSSDVLGNAIGSLGTQADDVCLSTYPFFVLYRTRTSPDIRLLAVNAFAMPSSDRVCEHYCPWYVI
jgi:hypothetical protein